MIQRGFIFGGLSTYMIAAVAVAVVLGYTYMKGRQDGREAILRENVQAAVRIIREQGAVTERVVTKYVKVAGETKVKREVIEKEVIKYVESGLDSCPISNRAVVLHNASAANILPPTIGPTDGAASHLATSALTKTCTENYAIHHETADRLRSLQSWVKGQQALR